MACADQLLDLDDSVGKWPSDRPHGLTIRCGYCTPLPTPDNEGSCMVFWACQAPCHRYMGVGVLWRRRCQDSELSGLEG